MLAKILNRYNPNFDLDPMAPPVTWAENEIAITVINLAVELRELRLEVETLKEEIKQKDAEKCQK